LSRTTLEPIRALIFCDAPALTLHETVAHTNVAEVGLGWTNAAFTELYARLPERQKAKVLELNGVGVP